MKKQILTSEMINSYGSEVIGHFEQVELKTSCDKSIRKQGFYFICHNSDVLYATHVGNQGRQRGFEDTMIRIRKPRTGQGKELHEAIKSRVGVELHFMEYGQVVELLGLSGYGHMNNGHELIGKLRSKYTIKWRNKS